MAPHMPNFSRNDTISYYRNSGIKLLGTSQSWL